MIFKKVIKTKVCVFESALKIYGICNKKVLGKIICIINKELRIITISDIECQKNNKGYASVMMNELVKYARQNEFKHINGWLSKVDYDHKERLYHFYQKFGFEIIQNDEGMKFADIKLEL